MISYYANASNSTINLYSTPPGLITKMSYCLTPRRRPDGDHRGRRVRRPVSEGPRGRRAAGLGPPLARHLATGAPMLAIFGKKNFREHGNG